VIYWRKKDAKSGLFPLNGKEKKLAKKREEQPDVAHKRPALPQGDERSAGQGGYN
jgi:hypothetical protein